ncbi:hypothetical protein EFL99_10105 [Lactococcus lactis]|uniref:ABC-three component system protein n=1 Tax=Lactococcus lactis TaxID=1358 RepID=UPI00223B7E2C|nr:ABC-three component system protein [Lactococcus lactis]MCT1183582.1 hypothetical protein [Lactococcus lactis]
MEEVIDELNYPESNQSFQLTQQDIQFGQAIDPVKRISIFSADEFESFIQLWVKENLQKCYNRVMKCGGAGDKGRDVIAYKYDGTWDNYQCKHYEKALSLNNILIEVGKLCYYTYNGSYSVPNQYYFVSPKGVTTSLLGYLDNPEELKKVLFERWEVNCRKKITKLKSIELTSDLRRHIQSIDFSIFKHVDPIDLINPIRGTMAYSSIFGGGLKKRRESPSIPPARIAEKELPYTRKIFEAYSDYLTFNVSNEQDISNNPSLRNHFERQRKYFYTAESLLLFERDIRAEDDDTITSIKEEILDTIIDTLESDFPNGYERLKAVTDRARQSDLSAHPLLSVTRENDKHGICHHLANENRFDWVKNNE